MSWQVLRIDHNPTQTRATLVNPDAGATCTSEYREADALARHTLGAATLSGHGYTLRGGPTRIYVSQMY